MKNNTTPRTLAECEFTTGYASASYREDAARIERRAHAAMYLLAVITLCCFAAAYIVGA